MRMPTKAVAYLRSFLILAVIGQALVACAGDTTAPMASSHNVAIQPSTLSPIAASHSLVGATDGEYVFTIDPTEDQSLEIGPNHLDIPANAICQIGASSYGPQFWDDRCRTETAPVTITATVRSAGSDHPRIDFEPALRFAPRKTVMLYMTLDKRADRAEWASIFYCFSNGKGNCVDEAKTDRSLTTSVRDRIVFRRIKHFSGYMVSTFAGSEE
jgi:hypothetical protein